MVGPGIQGGRRKRRVEAEGRIAELEGPRPKRAPGGRLGDGGHLAALEAAFVGMLMVSSVAIYVSIDQPAPSSTVNPQREPLEDLVEDLLEGMAAVPTNRYYASVLEKAISKAVQGDTEAFEDLVGDTMPPGTECRLFLDNGKERRLLAGPSERLARESVSKARLWRPEWAYNFAVPSLDLISSSQPANFQGYQVAQGALVKEFGVPLHWQLVTDAGTYDRASVVSVQNTSTVSITLADHNGRDGYEYTDPALTPTTSNAMTLSQNGPPPSPRTFDVPVGAVSLDLTAIFTGTAVAYTLTFTDPGNVPFPLVVNGLDAPVPLIIPAPNPGTWTMTGAGVHSGIPVDPATSRVYANVTTLTGNTNWTFRVNEEAGYNLSKGAVLNISFPQVFYDFALTNTTQANWTNITYGETQELGAWVTAELNTTLRWSSANLTVGARRPGGGDAMYDLHATLTGNGVSGRGSFIFGQPTGATTSANTIEHEMYISHPKPVAAGSTSTWGIVFANPRTLPSGPETLRTLDLWTADGSALFGTAPTMTWPVTGNWTKLSDSHIRWTASGTEIALSNDAQALAFKVPIHPNARTDHEDAIHIPIDFNNGARFQSQQQEKPYVHALQIPPPRDILNGPQAGYEMPRDAGPTTRGNNTANITQQQRGVMTRGEVVYGVSQWGTLSSVQESMRLGLARSHLNISKNAVKIGEELNVTVDFQGLYDEIALLGATVTGWSVEVSIFDPAQPFLGFSEMQPSYRGRFGANGSLQIDTNNTQVQGVAQWATSSTSVKNVANANLTYVPPRDAFYGPHSLISQANFVIKDSLGTSMTQAVRQLGIIDVLPDGGQSGTALYWASLECWLPDW